MYRLIVLETTNDVNGNPRRGFKPFRDDDRPQPFVEIRACESADQLAERMYGEHGYIILCAIAVSVAEYNRNVKLAQERYWER